MRVFLDANILFSAAKSSGAIRQLVDQIPIRGHECVADEYVIAEARRNLEQKFPAALPDFESLLRGISRLASPPALSIPSLNHSKNHYDPTKPSSGRAGSHARPTAGHGPAGDHPGEHFLFFLRVVQRIPNEG
jgi:hypothetical protein